MAINLHGRAVSNPGGFDAFRYPSFIGGGRAASLLLVLILSVCGLSSCVTKSVLPPSASEIVVSFSLSPPQALQLGSQTTLMVNVTNDVTDAGVDWVASCSAANCGNFNPIHTLSGVATVYTAPNSIPAGNTINLTAKSTASPSESVTVSIAIQSSISVTLTGFPASPLAAGSTTQITAKVTGDPNNLGVDWSLLCGAGNCGTITLQTASNVAATYTAPPVVTTSLNVTITATSVFDPTQTVTTNVTVTPSGSVSIAFGQNPPPPTAMNTSATASIVGIVSGDNTNAGVNWSVSCTNSSNTCGTFNPGSPAHTASGTAILYTAPATVPTNGLMVTVTATAAASPNPFVTAVITVTAPVPTIGPINGAPSSLPVNGKSNPLSATVTNDSTSNGGVDWSLNCTPQPFSGSVPPPNPCGTFSSGLSTDHTISGGTTTYTAPAVIPAGSPANVTISASSTANSSSTSTAIITITPSTAVTIKFATAPPSTLLTNATATVSATVTNDPNVPPLGVDWALACTGAGGSPCGSLSVAHTSSGGSVVYTAPGTVPSGGNGGVTITATATAAPNPSVSGTVTILPPNVAIVVTAESPLDAGSAEQVSAVVTGDTTNAGVSWSASCTQTAGAGCGTFNPVSSPGTSSPTSSYTAPASVPTGAVTITATSLAAGVSAVGTAQVTIQPNASLGLLKGPYALSVSGQNSSGFFAVVGSVTADGSGNITTGAEDINSLFGACSPSSNFAPVTGSYSVGPDGRGSMTLQTGNTTCFGDGGVQTLSFVVVGAPGTSSVRALVTEFDNTTASGSLDLQTLSAVISGNYAFTMSGVDVVSQIANSIAANVGGVFVASAGSITSGFQDENDQGSGVVLKKQALVAEGTYTAPDPATGRGTITFGPNNAQYTYVYYIVNSGEFKLVSYDVTDDLAVSGIAYTQGTSTFPVQNAFTLSGTDGTLDSSIVAGGIFGVSGTSIAGGSFIDVNDNGPQETNAILTGSFSALSSGRGTLTLTLPTPPVTLTGFGSFAYYPTANNGVLLLDLDTNFASVGVAYPQTQGDLSLTFNGTYAMNLTGAVSGSPEEDVDGLVISDNTGVLSGTVDVNGAPVASDLGGIILTGSYTTNTTNGRFPGSLNLDLTSSDIQKLTEIFYVLNANTVLFIENDINGQTSGILQLQNLTLP